MDNTNEVAVISSTEALQAVTSAEIDKQIATAKAYPRDNGGVNNIIFEAVSSLVNYAKEIGATIARVVTHKSNGEEEVTV